MLCHDAVEVLRPRPPAKHTLRVPMTQQVAQDRPKAGNAEAMLVPGVVAAPVLGNDTVEILGPCRPAFDIPRVIVTALVAQHRGLAGRIRARGMPWVLAAGYHMAF